MIPLKDGCCFCRHSNGYGVECGKGHVAAFAASCALQELDEAQWREFLLKKTGQQVDENRF